MQLAAHRRLSQPVKLFARDLSDAGRCRYGGHARDQARLLRRHAQSQPERDHPARPRARFRRAARPRAVRQRRLTGTMEAYQYPHYYEIALAPDDPAREVDFFEAVITRFSRSAVHRVFELASGTAPYLQEWHKRGYAYCGLDLSPAMVEFGRDKARSHGIEATF